MKNNIPLRLSFLYIGFCFFAALFTYFLIPDKTTHANSMNLRIQSEKPGFKTKIIKVPLKDYKMNFFDFFIGSEKIYNEYPISDLNTVGDKLNLKLVSGDDESVEKLIDLNVFKSSDLNYIVDNYVEERTYLFGTDIYGRDLFSRVMLGTRVSLSIGLMAVFISTVLGVFFGVLGGYFGGYLDKVVVWIINVFWSIPTLLLVIAISISLGKGFWQVYIAIGCSIWVEVARIVRGKIISEKAKDYIVAVKVLGLSNLRIIIYHILPNIIGPILIIAATNFASSILLESGLSFLGIGTQPPMPSWGYMIKENYQYILLGNAYLALIPGIFLMLLVTSFMYISNYYSEKIKI